MLKETLHINLRVFIFCVFLFDLDLTNTLNMKNIENIG